MTDLGAPSGGHYSQARGINDVGQVVGFAYVNGGRRAFLYSQGRMQDLNDLVSPASGWILSDANAINNKGQIVGMATFNSGVYSYLLTPTALLKSEAQAPSVPSLSTTSFFLEAESGVLSSPMAVFCDAQASGGKYISSAGNESAIVSFLISVQTPGTYAIWTRVRALSPEAGSFSVSVDGGAAEAHDAGEGTDLTSWQWRRVSHSAGAGALKHSPRLLNLTGGSHTIVFRTKTGMREASKLDRLIITTDLNFDPNKLPSRK